MPSSIAHASAAILLSPVLYGQAISRRLIGITALAAVFPDIDAIGRPFGHGDLDSLGGHRALTHSVFFALAEAAAIAIVASLGNPTLNRWRVGVYAAAVILSHGVLDACTTYGAGVAFLSPFSLERWKFSWQPIDGVVPEILAIWLPALLMYRLWLRERLGRLKP